MQEKCKNRPETNPVAQDAWLSGKIFASGKRKIDTFRTAGDAQS